MEIKISEETAQESIETLIEYYGIDLDTMTEGVRAAIESSIAKIKSEIMLGKLEIICTDETIEIKQHLHRPITGAPNPIVYNEVTAAAKLGIREDSGDYGKMYTFLGALSGEGLVVIRKLRGRDVSVAEALGCVFLQV